MKVFGGNGKRQNNSSRGAGIERNGNTDKTHIKSGNDGYKNESIESRQSASQPDPSQKRKKKGKGWLIALIVVVAIATCAFIYWKLTTKPPEISQINPPSGEGDTVQITDTETREIGHYYTILVVGIDQLGLNTDTMMLVRYDAVDHKANIVSIPRDTAVNTPESVKKINAAYMYADSNGESGIDALMSYVRDITGFMPDNYALIDTDVFVKAIDALGGAYFDVPVNMDYDDYSDNNDDGITDYVFTIHVQKGYQLLDGENALGVFRFRQNNNGTGYAMGDIERLETQHALLKAVAAQALQLKNLASLISIAQIVIDNSQTDLSIGNMQWFAQQFLKMTVDDIDLSTMPTTGCWVNGLAYVTINVDEWMTIINEKLNPMKFEISPEACSILCQKVSEPDKYTFTESNYYTTDGQEVYTNFYKNNK